MQWGKGKYVIVGEHKGRSTQDVENNGEADWLDIIVEKQTTLRLYPTLHLILINQIWTQRPTEEGKKVEGCAVEHQ